MKTKYVFDCPSPLIRHVASSIFDLTVFVNFGGANIVFINFVIVLLLPVVDFFDERFSFFDHNRLIANIVDVCVTTPLPAFFIVMCVILELIAPTYELSNISDEKFLEE